MSEGAYDYPKTYDGYTELEGECYYKSGWVEVDWPGGLLNFTKPKGPKHCWARFDGWWFYLYTHYQYWYNWKPSGNSADDESFLKKMAEALPDMRLPSLPNLSLPSLSMPSLSMPSLSMPSMSMPSLSAPSLSMPSLGKIKAPKKKTFQEDPMLYLRLRDESNIKKSGKTVTLTGNAYMYYKNDPSEEVKKYKVVFSAPSDKQADSWFETVTKTCPNCKAL